MGPPKLHIYPCTVLKFASIFISSNVTALLSQGVYGLLFLASDDLRKHVLALTLPALVVLELDMTKIEEKI